MSAKHTRCLVPIDLPRQPKGVYAKSSLDRRGPWRCRQSRCCYCQSRRHHSFQSRRFPKRPRALAAARRTTARLGRGFCRKYAPARRLPTSRPGYHPIEYCEFAWVDEAGSICSRVPPSAVINGNEVSRAICPRNSWGVPPLHWVGIPAHNTTA